MKRGAILLLLALLTLPLRAQCQTAAPTITEQKFTLTGKVSALNVNGTALIAADAVACIQISPLVVLREDNTLISLPATSTTTTASAGPLGEIFTAGPQFNLPNFLKGTALGTDNYQWYAYGQLGISRSSANQTMAESIGLGLSYRPSAMNPTVVNIFDVAWVHGSIPNGISPTTGQPQYGNNALRVSIGIGF